MNVKISFNDNNQEKKGILLAKSLEQFKMNQINSRKINNQFNWDIENN